MSDKSEMSGNENIEEIQIRNVDNLEEWQKGAQHNNVSQWLDISQETAQSQRDVYIHFT